MVYLLLIPNGNRLCYKKRWHWNMVWNQRRLIYSRFQSKSNFSRRVNENLNCNITFLSNHCILQNHASRTRSWSADRSMLKSASMFCIQIFLLKLHSLAQEIRALLFPIPCLKLACELFDLNFHEDEHFIRDACHKSQPSTFKFETSDIGTPCLFELIHLRYMGTFS